MSTYIIGDIHGCFDEFIALLKKIEFSSKKDTLWLTGDLVFRGPKSLEVLRYVKSLGDCVYLVLGNHDLHLLAIYAGINSIKISNYFMILLKAHDINELLNWLRQQPLLQINEEKKLIMSHAGITPQWDLQTARDCAHDVEKILTSDSYSYFLKSIYDNLFNNCDQNDWNQDLKGIVRLRFIINVFTRMRYCLPNKKLNMHYKDNPNNVPVLLKPWFSIPSLITKEYNIVFGHWASLEGKGTPKNIYALDTGCCWGNKLTCLRWEDKMFFSQKCLK